MVELRSYKCSAYRRAFATWLGPNGSGAVFTSRLCRIDYLVCNNIRSPCGKMLIIQLMILFFIVCYLTSNPVSDHTSCLLEEPVVKKFQKYLQIDTSRSENLYKAVHFLQSLAIEAGLEFAVYEPAGKPICVITWPGTDCSLPSIMLNSHVDVVEAKDVGWKYPPFAAYIDENCDIYARGAQDTKDLGIQYLEAIRRLKSQNFSLKRTIHVTYMPDEETGGFQGMRVFLKMDEFKDLNVGLVLDEGIVDESDKDFYASYQDRRAWSMNFTVEGDGGHGFLMPKDVAAGKLSRLLSVMLDYRSTLEEEVQSVPLLFTGPYASLNINMINGGQAPNVIPNAFSLVADMRLAASANATEILSVVNAWAEYAGRGTKLEFLRREMESLATPVDNTNPYWITLKETVNNLGFNLIPIILPATSDSMFVRNHGIPAFGFAPRFNLVQRVHNTNEYNNVHVFMRGIEIYEEIIKNLGNLECVSVTNTD